MRGGGGGFGHDDRGYEGGSGSAEPDRESLPEDGLQREDWRVGLHPHGDRLDGIGHGGGVQCVVDQGAEGGVSPGPDVDAGKEERVVRAGQEWRDGAVGA